MKKEARKLLREAVNIVIKEVARGTGKEIADTVRKKIRKIRKMQEDRKKAKEEEEEAQ